jgi:hypothetical protein
MKPQGSFFFSLNPLVGVDLPPFVDHFHHEIEVTLDWKAFISTLAHSSCLSSMALHVWCMNSYETILSQMIIKAASTSFLMYVGTLLEFMFHLHYCVCFLQFNS